MPTRPKSVLFDFGGVIAEEGFEAGLKAIAVKNRLDPDAFFRLAEDLIYDTGYLTGRAEESMYWRVLRERTGIGGTDEELREGILKRFVLRPAMVNLVDRLRAARFITVLLSDQTNWLEEIDGATGLFSHFDRVFNSIRIKMSKRDGRTFTAVAGLLQMPARDLLFIDDNPGHVDRAIAAGLLAIRFTTIEDCEREVRRLSGIP